MKLTPEQLKRFDDEGYLFFPNYFSPEETQILKDSIPEVFAQRREENVREKTGDVVRTAFAVHTYHPVFEALVHHPRFVEPAEQFLRDRTYIHQFKINGKAAFDGDVWQWHQDYGTWKADDDMPEARAMNLAVFVDEVNEFNGPLWFIPQSHKKGAIEAKHDLTTTSYPLWVIDNDTIAKLVEAGRHRGAQGRAGLGDLLPRHAGAWQPAQHVAVGPPDHLCDLQRGLQRHPPLQAAGIHRPSRLHAGRCLGGRRRAARRPAQGGRGIRTLTGGNKHESPSHASGARGRRQSAAHRRDRRRQVRLDVSVADPDHARHPSAGHRRSLATEGEGEPGAAGLEARGHRGRLVRRGAPSRQHPSLPTIGARW